MITKTAGRAFDPDESNKYFTAGNLMGLFRTGGAVFDSSEPNKYFIASNIDRQQWGAKIHQNILVAVNEINTQGQIDTIKQWIAGGSHLFIDSGVFTLAMNHARAHNVSHDVALNLAPDDIDGFKELFDRYVEVIRELGESSWGYIEIDQGGRKNKMKTRAKLEKLGLRPIPVYHPFGDGWEYFDYLAQHYDRICFGNVVKADRRTRIRLVATAWERRRKYPKLWIHLLGLTPNQWMLSFPINSADSSTWLSSVRWHGVNPRCDLVPFGGLPIDFKYKLASVPESSQGSQRAIMMSAKESAFTEMIWRSHLQGLRELGFDLCPKP